jgi:glutamyl/glutaminyl-tRNA synthetase
VSDRCEHCDDPVDFGEELCWPCQEEQRKRFEEYLEEQGFKDEYYNALERLTNYKEAVELLMEMGEYYKATTPCELSEYDEIQLSDNPKIWTCGKKARETLKKVKEILGCSTES